MKGLLILLLFAGIASAEIRQPINSVDAETLMAMQGIGESKATAIINWRTANDGICTPEDLAQVPGIGAATLSKIKDRFLYPVNYKAFPKGTLGHRCFRKPNE